MTILNYIAKNVSKVTGRAISESNSNIDNELSMALIAGGLEPWSFNIESNTFYSSERNSIIGSNITLEELRTRVSQMYFDYIMDILDEIINKGSKHSETTIYIKNLKGEYVWLNIHAIPHVYTPDGKVSIITGSQKDITAEYEYDKQILLLHKHNEIILNNIKSGLVYITSDYVVKWQNIDRAFNNQGDKKYYIPGEYCYKAFNRDTPCEGCVAERAMKSGKSEITEIATKEGVSLEILANPILGDNGAIDGVILRIDDVTEKKNRIEQLKKTEQAAIVANKMLQTIIDNLPASLFVKDASDDYKYVIANKQFCINFGVSEENVIGKTDYDLFESKEEADRYRKDDIETVESNTTKIIDGEYVSIKDKQVVWHTIKTSLTNPYDNKKFLIGIGLDITENHNAYNELSIQKKKAEQSDILKSTFLANMSHEIRTPLNAIIGFSGLMKDCTDELEKNDYWDIINTNNDLLLRLISDILDLSKIESGMIELISDEFNLSDLIERIYVMLQLRQKNKEVEFLCDSPYKSCIVHLDENRITQILTNFVTNAFKFTPSGKITMGYKYEDNGILLYCKDTGIGIAKDKINKVFERFSKLDNFAQGTGLGTAICKAITDAYGGKVGVESTVNEGSYFWAWIPCEAEIKKDIEECKVVEQSTPVESERSGSSKILVAEDNDSNFLLIRAMLKGYNMTRAHNGAEAVELAKKEYFDTILMDINMPVMNGIDATKTIREFNKEIVIIAVTANAFESDRKNALDAGCNKFLAKPISRTKLMDVLNG